MRREPALSLEGALKILGAGPEQRWLSVLDKALGRVILASDEEWWKDCPRHAGKAEGP
ncbi:hypothetical protein [Actinoplanes sp. TFC3]|uniref:hypothetical protein n=1 Tax=Actinoplanes sp. TFC3 TaxID=1710355 RepID=UPI000AD6FA36|nr:hypothetical protein [Actinoplanes sp. TFC3]